MQTTYRLKAKEIGMTFLKSLKTLFAGQEIEITVKSVEPKEKKSPKGQNRLLEMIKENRQKAPLIAQDVDVRGLIDEAQYPSHQ
jgi:hypothetical protein